MKLFLLGYYGYQNIGDEALLFSITHALKVRGFNDLKALTYNAQETEQHYEIKAVSRGKNIGIVRHIRQSDAIIAGGGSLLQDITSSKSLYYYLSIFIIGKFFGKKIYLLGNGFGPIIQSFNHKLLNWFIPKFDGIIARDLESYEAFKAFGAKRSHLGVDCVFTMNTTTITRSVNTRPYVAFSLRPWRDMTKTMQAVTAAICHLNILGYDSVLIPMKAPDDVKQLKPLLEIGDFVKLSDHNLTAILSYLKGAACVVGMRLHALVLTATVHTPIIAISYDPKVDSFVKQLLNAKALNTQNITDSLLINKIEDVLDDPLETVSKINKTVEVTIQKAQIQFDVLAQWLNETGEL